MKISYIDIAENNRESKNMQNKTFLATSIPLRSSRGSNKMKRVVVR